MAQISEAHNTPSLIFKSDGVLPKMVVDKSKEKSLGAFARKCREDECYLIKSKPNSTWSQMSEGCIRKLKRD